MMNSWIPTLVEVSYEFGSIVLCGRSAVRPFRISELAHKFLFFCMKLDSHEVRKVTKPDLKKKSWRVNRAQTTPKMT